MRLAFGLALLLSVVLNSAFRAQVAQPPTSSQPFRTQTSAVPVDVIVRDSRGHLVTDLTREDFEILEDGLPQQLTTFEAVKAPGSGSLSSGSGRESSAPSALPRKPDDAAVVALVFDRLSLEARPLARDAANLYIEQAHRRGDRAAVFAIDLSLIPLQEYTDAAELLREAVGRAATLVTTPRVDASFATEYSAPGSDGSRADGWVDPVSQRVGSSATSAARIFELFKPREREQQGHATVTALRAVARSLSGVPGRKAVVLFSEGVPLPSNIRDHFYAAIDEANRANVTIYTLDAAGLRVRSIFEQTRRAIGPGSGEGGSVPRIENTMLLDSWTGLTVLARETGGFFVDNTNDLRPGVRRLAEEMHSYYLLSYTSSNSRLDGRYRRITVKIKRPGLEVRARRGYHAIPPILTMVPVLPYEAAAYAALDAPTLSNVFPMRLASLSFPESKRPGLTPVLVEVETRHLTFERQPDTQLYTTDFTILARFKDDRDRVIRKVSQHYSMRGPVAQLDRATRGTVLFYKTPEIPPGVYTLEAVVFDALADRASSRIATVEVPHADENTLRVSSLMIVRRSEKVPEKERDPQNPLYYGELSLYPNLGEPLTKGADKELAFFVTVYPRRPDDRLDATVELLHNGRSLGAVPTALPSPGVSGRIQYVGRLPLEALSPGVYQLRFAVASGSHRVSRSTAVRVE